MLVFEIYIKLFNNVLQTFATRKYVAGLGRAII